MQDIFVRAQVELDQLGRRLRSETGQTSIEYLGILVVVVGVLTVIIAAAPGFGQTIVGKINELIGKLA